MRRNSRRRIVTMTVPAVVTAMAALASCGKFAPIGQATTTAGRNGHPSQAPAAAPSLSASPEDSVSGLLDPASGKYLGVEASGAPDSLSPVSTFATAVGHKPDMIGQYIGWGSPFDAHAASTAWSYGALYFMSWEPYDTTVADIAAGDSNSYITSFATSVRALDIPVALSFGHEMNGNWYPWGTTGTTPAQFVAAWRLIYAIFAGVGATNVIWVWNPNDIYPVPQVQLQPYWPGDAYVDWVGITGYFATTGPQTFATLYEPTIDQIREFTSKPFIIAETAVENGPNDVACVSALLQTVTANSDVLGLIWFDYDKDGVDWRVESRPAIQAAFAQDAAGLQVVNVRS
jgi:mannan endo-1,4-beta-mannosidase